LALLAVVAGLILSASLIALALLVPVLIASIAMFRRRKRRISRIWALALGLLALLYVGVVAFTSFHHACIWEEAVAGPNSRHGAVGTSIGPAVGFQPLGSGIGPLARKSAV